MVLSYPGSVDSPRAGTDQDTQSRRWYRRDPSHDATDHGAQTASYTGADARTRRAALEGAILHLYKDQLLIPREKDDRISSF